MKTPLTGKALRQHLTYSWWKYLLMAGLVALSVSMLYSVRTYHPPEGKKVELYVCAYANQDWLDAYMESVRVREMPEMEKMDSLVLQQSDVYANSQLTVYLAAREGDIYLVPKETFKSLYDQGILLPLDEDKELLSLFENPEEQLRSGYRKNRLYGIPTSVLPTLGQFVASGDNFLTVVAFNQNDENVFRFLRILVKDMIQPLPAETDPAAAAES